MVKVSKEVAEENRHRLAQSADILSRRHGLARVSLGDVAKHAKLTTGAIYARFGSREELLAAGIASGFERMVLWLETLESAQAYREAVLSGGRMASGELWCPAMSHIGAIRVASQPEQNAFARGLDRMLTQMTHWPDVSSKAQAKETLAAVTGPMLMGEIPD